MHRRFVVAVLLSFAATVVWSAFAGDPYATLSVGRSASGSEVKQAYKRLAKFWHPDRNKSPDAAKRFVEVNEAYELLSDPERRRRYDDFGTDDGAGSGLPPDEQHFFRNFRFAGDSFGPFQFQFDAEASSLSRNAINLRIYEQTVLPTSSFRPYLIFVYAEWCIVCMQTEPLWKRIVSDLQPIGFGVATVNIILEGTLAERLRVRRLPMLVSVVDGRISNFDGKMTVKEVLRFARTAFPSNLMTPITEFKDFRLAHADAVRRNRVLVLIFSDQEKPRLRYLVSALRLRPYCRFTFVNMRLAYAGLMDDFKPAREARVDTLLIFREVATVPVFRLELSESAEMPASVFHDAIQSRKLLSLPRLSSAKHFDQICPPNALAGPGPFRWCAILVTNSKRGSDDHQLFQFRVHAVQQLSAGRASSVSVRPCYVYEDIQAAFVDVLLQSNKSAASSTPRTDSFYTIVLLLRLNKDTAKFLTLRNIWNGNDETSVNQSIERLRFYVQQTTSNDDRPSAMLHEAQLPELVDEGEPNLYKKLAARFMRGLESFSYQLTKEEVLPIVSVLGTLGAICLMGYVLNYVSNISDNLVSSPPKPKSFKKSEELSRLIRELRAETYFGMVRLLKPGCRTIVLLCDADSKDVLLPQFGQIIWPWRRNKTLMFGYVMLEKNLSWFRSLLELTLPDPNLVNINARNVVGTVLSLNGFRQYFCVYHPKYASSMTGYGKHKSRSNHLHSLGLNSDYSDSTDDERRERELLRDIQKKKVLQRDELLDGLPNWLDRLFEGSVKRFYIAQWPSIR